MAATDYQNLLALIDRDIPEGRKSLQDNYTNLEHVAKYCESNYLQASDKRKALEETKNYTTHSLASVAYQINALATNFLNLLDLQQTQLANMESSVNHLSQIVMIHKEKVARREIGVLTTNRTASRPLGVKSGILFPEQTERPIKYTRKPIDYSVLDEVGHGVRPQQQGSGTTPRSGRSSSVSSSGSGSQAPTTRPPTPPVYRQGSTGTIGRASGSQYRTVAPPVAPAAPPQAPSLLSIHQVGGGNAPVKIQGPYAPAPGAQMGQIRMPTGMMGRPGSQAGRESMMMMMPGGPVMMVPGGPGMGQRPKSNTHIVQPAPSPLTGQESIALLRYRYQAPGGLKMNHVDLSPPSFPLDSGDDMFEEAMPPLPPPPDAGADSFDYPQMPPTLPPPEFSDMQGHRSESQSGLPEDPYAATGPGLLGQESWMPKTYIEKVVGIYDYEADKEDELSFSENAVIYVIRKNDDGWWEGVMDGITGLFPSNYVEPCM
ncbi:abl interactor 2-like [Pomacea canaliculata]|uniref:abl interactor 2-like n=1 Tax=Pomacea canaliculata TaxID=400727 RepID=UPI000D73CC5E|nr:abl interactor 2-like [Pomacea canaliculata]